MTIDRLCQIGIDSIELHHAGVKDLPADAPTAVELDSLSEVELMAVSMFCRGASYERRRGATHAVVGPLPRIPIETDEPRRGVWPGWLLVAAVAGLVVGMAWRTAQIGQAREAERIRMEAMR